MSKHLNDGDTSRPSSRRRVAKRVFIGSIGILVAGILGSGASWFDHTEIQTTQAKMGALKLEVRDVNGDVFTSDNNGQNILPDFAMENDTWMPGMSDTEKLTLTNAGTVPLNVTGRLNSGADPETTPPGSDVFSQFTGMIDASASFPGAVASGPGYSVLSLQIGTLQPGESATVDVSFTAPANLDSAWQGHAFSALIVFDSVQGAWPVA
jgi:hypothetical protein